jgi:hypothetical protein
VGSILGNAIGEKVDADVFAQFDSLTTNVINSSGTDLSPNDILKAIYLLRGQNAPADADGDYFGVFSPAQLHNVAKVLTQAGFVGSQAPAISNLGNALLSSSAYMGKIYNCKIFMTTAVTVDSANDSVGRCILTEWHLHTLIKRPIVVREQYDASLRSTEYVATTARGNAILKDAYG